MAAKKTKSDDGHFEAEIQEKTEIWKQIIITTGVVLVALIGSWQVLSLARLNNQPPTSIPSPLPVMATNTPVPIQPSNTIAPAVPVAVVATTELPSATNTAPAKSLNLKAVNIDSSKWYRITNDSLGKGYALDHWADTKDMVMNATGSTGGQSWGFNVAGPGYYTITSEFYGQGIFLHVLTNNNNSLNLDPGKDDPKSIFWQLTSSTSNCVRFTSQALGDGWSLDLTTTNNIPAPYIAQTSDSTTQCWHLTQVGSIK